MWGYLSHPLFEIVPRDCMVIEGRDIHLSYNQLGSNIDIRASKWNYYPITTKGHFLKGHLASKYSNYADILEGTSLGDLCKICLEIKK